MCNLHREGMCICVWWVWLGSVAEGEVGMERVKGIASAHFVMAGLVQQV